MKGSIFNSTFSRVEIRRAHAFQAHRSKTSSASALHHPHTPTVRSGLNGQSAVEILLGFGVLGAPAKTGGDAVQRVSRLAGSSQTHSFLLIINLSYISFFLPPPKTECILLVYSIDSWQAA